MVVVIEETKDLSTMSFNGLMGSLRSYEQRLLQRIEMSIESVFQSKLIIQSNNDIFGFGRGRGRGRNSCGNGRGTYGGQRSDEGSNRWCGICERSSHEEKDCWLI